jgi:hypothetical protein
MAGFKSASFNPDDVATSSDAASSALAAIAGASDAASSALVAASNALAKAAAASSKISAQSSAWEAGGTGLFAVDGDGNLEPGASAATDEYYELDANSDIQPKAA